MEIKDLAGLSQPLTKLIEVISNGIGTVSQPYLIRKNAEAKAEEIKLISNALKDVQVNHSLPVDYDNGEIQIWQKPDDHTLIINATSVEERADLRLDFKERKRQENIEKVTSAAATELVNENVVSEEMPDEDWVSRFFTYAEDISSHEMQELWGRILAGEVRAPGTYSLKTLDFIRNISKKDAELVEYVARFALKWGATYFIAMPDLDWMREENEIYPSHQFDLGELGILYPTDLSLRFFNNDQISEEVVTSGDHILVIGRNKIDKITPLTIWKYTKVGQELLSLVPPEYNQSYLEKISETFNKTGGDVTIGKVKEILPDGQMIYNIIKKL